jgi:cell division protein FtsZ
VVTKPFSMEGKKRLGIAEQGIAELGKYVDSLITIPNEKLLSVLGPETTLLDAFKAANEVLQGAVQGIAELITRPGLINVDFADVRTVMSEMGMAMMGSGSARGTDRAREAAEAAISSPLLEDVNLSGARGILVNVTAGENLSIGEFRQVGETVKQCASEDATVVIGTVIDPEMGEGIRVTVVATGLGQPVVQQKQPPIRVVTGNPRAHAPAAGNQQQYAQAAEVETGYTQYEQPTFLRRRAVGDQLTEGADANLDLLDVPAFLRRQAD